MLTQPNNNYEKEITKLIADITELDENLIWDNRDANFFEQLEIDSLLALEILAAIERKYKIDIPEEKLEMLTSVNATISMIKEIIEEKMTLRSSN